MIPMALQTVKVCDDTSAAGALETGMMLAGRPGPSVALAGPGPSMSVPLNVRATDIELHVPRLQVSLYSH